MTSDHPIDMTCEAFAEALPALLERELDAEAQAAAERHAAGCVACGSLLADLRQLEADAALLPALEPSRDLWAGIAARIEAPVVALPSAVRGGRWAVRDIRWLRHPARAAAALVLVTAGVTYVATRASIDSASGTPTVAADAQRPTPTAHRPDTDAAALSGRLAEQQALAAAEGAAAEGATADDATAERGEVRPKPRPGGIERAVREPVASLASDAGVEVAGGVESAYGLEIARLRGVIDGRRPTLDPATVTEIERNLAIIDSAIVRSRAALRRDPASGFLTEQLSSALEKKVELLRTAATLPAARS